MSKYKTKVQIERKDKLILAEKSLTTIFNNKSIEERREGCGDHFLSQIQHLNFEKSRLTKRYRASLAEINDHIKNCEDSLLATYKEMIK